MQSLKFEFDINRELPFVFEKMYDKEVFRTWSSAFAEDSHYEGDLVEGADIKFLDLDKNGVGGIVKKIIPNEYLEFNIMQEYVKGEVVNFDPPGKEAYTFSTTDDGKTHIEVNVDMKDEYVDNMVEMWKIAIKSIIKTLEEL